MNLRLAAIAIVLALPGCREPVVVRGDAAPIVAGIADHGLSSRQRGLVLLDELGCVACHAHHGGDARSGPALAGVGARLRDGHLTAFLADPLGVEPGTTMPDMLRALGGRARDRATAELTAYLLSFAGDGAAVVDAAGTADASAARARGQELYLTMGCIACHVPRDEAGFESPLAGSAPLGDLAAKYRPGALRAFLLAPHAVRPSARMPDFGLSPAMANDLTSFLLGAAGEASTATDAPAPPAPDLVAAGRQRFAALRCANCHGLADATRPAAPQPPAMADVDPARGCLSGGVGAWPYYALTAAQRDDVGAALEQLEEPLPAEARIVHQLAQRNCLACHARGEYGGIGAERGAYFLSADPSVGHEGRVPPPLTGVGAKLQRDWLADAIAHGQSVRPYLRTRMPGFGAAFADGLTTLLTATDELPALELRPLPNKREDAKKIVDLGRELVGDNGMNCVSCHFFAGQRVGAMAAVDLVDSTRQRLRPEWFAHFMRDPFAFKPGTLMPQFFPDGESTRPELGDGDRERQIEAMWHYLAKGRNVGAPRGMRRPPIELVVGDEAVMLRRSVQHTGKRGISVGYPGGVNLTFDAERLGLNQIWWGRFVDAGGVWRGQGSGQARILGKPRFELPNGPAFAALANSDAPWPTQTRRELGHRWLGYDLDDEQRPSFRYTCGDVTITDTPREVVIDTPAAGALALQRLLLLEATADTTLSFLVARHSRIEASDVTNFVVDGKLAVGILSEVGDDVTCRVREVGETRELLVEIPVRDGRTELHLFYSPGNGK